MPKKAQSISINTIIIAAIALAVLVVIFFIFTGRFKIFSEGVKEGSLNCAKACKATGHTTGSGSPTGSCQGTNQNTISGKFDDVPDGQVCCCSS